MGDENIMTDTSPDGRVGFRDIYRAVGESELRITTAISAAVSPINSMLADHEVRIRSLESEGGTPTKVALTRLAQLEAQTEELHSAQESALAISRRRSSDFSLFQKVVVTVVLVSNFVLGLVLALFHI